MLERRRITVSGIVQGIGFRPFVYRLAHDAQLTGWVRNDGGGVHMELQGAPVELERLLGRLSAELPPGGRIDRLASEPRPVEPTEPAFVITESEAAQELRVSIAPDRFVCAACLQELGDPSDRRYRYPFINCTHCGPRYTIAIELPYDRAATTMAGFELCEACHQEYVDPLDRRYHAEPVACPRCGPRAWLVAAGSTPLAELARPPAAPRPTDAESDPIAETIRRLAAGQIVAIKGIGGFHLACDARNELAVARLRQRKHRDRKPLAVMVRDSATAQQLARLDGATAELLQSPAAPIVLAPRAAGAAIAEGIAPGLGDVGIMLPYSPLHHLLFQGPLDALVMTSGNHPAEPITTDNRDALEHLPADAWLLHDRDIHVANDDSVVRTSAEGPLLVRRSRGYVPEPFDGSHLPARTVLALGGQLKVTVCTLSRGELCVGRHLGDLDNPRAEEAFRQEVDRMLRFAQVEPEAVALDLHPDLASAHYAEERFGDRPLLRIQHHHAHLTAVMAEHGLGPDAEVIGIVLDGFGHGTDQAIWGGELLRGGYRQVERVGHLRYVPQPGGDRGALEPYRMATSHLVDAGLGEAGLKAFDEQIAAICTVAAVSPPTSSAGRLFDAAAAILEVAPEAQDFEGEAAMLLEAVADASCDDAYPLPAWAGVLDTRALVEALVQDRASVAVRAARFHNGLADGLAAVALAAGAEPVVLGGGCMINRLLLRRLLRRLAEAHRQTLWPKRLPAGDGGLAVGQAASAACLLEEEDPSSCA